MARTSFRYWAIRSGAHVHVRVWAGPDEQHRASCGEIVFRPDEWEDFAERVAGPGHTVDYLSDEETPERRTHPRINDWEDKLHDDRRLT